jgi:hypothetical protein
MVVVGKFEHIDNKQIYIYGEKKTHETIQKHRTQKIRSKTHTQENKYKTYILKKHTTTN